jgi:signal peptidase I
MKKTWIAAGVFCAVLFVSLIIARLTGALQFYVTPSSSMSPTIEVGEHFISSNLISPKVNDIVVFERIADEYDGVQEPGTMQKFTYRLVAKGGDTLQVQDGMVYINGRYADDSSRLKFRYAFASNHSAEMLKFLGKEESKLTEWEWASHGGDSIFALLTYAEYIQLKPVIFIRKVKSDYIPQIPLYKNDAVKKWTDDDYGPLLIPPGTYFMMGDNRTAARDSRFIGPIPARSIKGVMLKKY